MRVAMRDANPTVVRWKRRMSSWLQRFLPVPIGRVVAEVLPPPATVTRAEIVAALDDIIEHEEGPRFQSLAVILARQTYPQLIASERKWDHGLDAHAPRSGSNPALGLTFSITASRYGPSGGVVDS